MATAISEEEAEIREAATGEDYTSNLHETAELKDDSSAPNAEGKGLAELTPIGTPVSARGETFYIKGWEIGDILEVANDLANFGLNFAAVDKNDLPLIMAIVINQLDTVLKVIAITIGKDVPWTKRISLNDMPEIIKAILKENEPFFRQAADLLPANRQDTSGTGAPENQSENEEIQANETPLTGSD